MGILLFIEGIRYKESELQLLMKEYKQERWQYERKWTIGDHSGSQDNDRFR